VFAKRYFFASLGILAASGLLHVEAGAQMYLTQWGSYGTGNGQFVAAYGVATDAAGNVYVVETDGHRIQKFTDTGTYLTQWGSYGSGNGQFDDPFGVAVDASGNVYVADHGNHRIQKFGWLLTPTKSTSWGRIKALYR